MRQPEQLSFDFETIDFTQTVIRLFRAARKLREKLRKHDAAIRRAFQAAEDIAGCSLDGWDEDTLVEYLRLFLRLQNAK
jgi:hypothetical protein